MENKHRQNQDTPPPSYNDVVRNKKITISISIKNKKIFI
jgi:hypothetical protein